MKRVRRLITVFSGLLNRSRHPGTTAGPQKGHTGDQVRDRGTLGVKPGPVGLYLKWLPVVFHQRRALIKGRASPREERGEWRVESAFKALPPAESAPANQRDP